MTRLEIKDEGMQLVRVNNHGQRYGNQVPTPLPTPPAS